MAKSSRRKPGQTGRNTDANTGADSQNDLPDDAAVENEPGDDQTDALDDEEVAARFDDAHALDDNDVDDEDLDEEELDEDDDEIAPAAKGRTATADKSKSDKTKKKPAAHASAGGPARFVRESAAELGKVVWPTRKQMITYTIVVVIFVVFLVAAIGFYDIGISNLMMKIFG